MKRPGIALQLYSVRDDCARDFFGTLEKVAAMGFEGVEFAGFYGRSAGELRDRLRELGLSAAGSHESLQRVVGDALEETVGFNLELGNRTIVVPWLPPQMRSDRRGWESSAVQIGGVAEKCDAHGIRVGYHNHREEFLPIDGEYPWDIFFRSAGPRVFMQLDTGNALSAGINDETLVETLRRYPGRALTIHLKDYSRARGFVLLGEGDVPLRRVIDACMDVGGTEWFIVEIEAYPYPPLESVRICLENLRRML
jgi:sugar phosphate isomerase/epimerase